jgi:putative glutamine amidotransferase
VKIALTRTDNPEKHQYYLDWLREVENVEVITLSAQDNNLSEMGACDGLVLSGGRDIHPKYYGSKNLDYKGAPEYYSEQRDDFEIAAFKQAKDEDLPILGICRGLQLINVICNGSLIQSLDDFSGSKNHLGNPDKIHSVSIQPGTLLYDIVGHQDGEVNSAHHQAIDRLGEGLLINSLAADGTIEGIEWQQKSGRPFMLAIQWHPERMFRFHLEKSDLSKKIKDRFIEEIKKTKD